MLLLVACSDEPRRSPETNLEAAKSEGAAVPPSSEERADDRASAGGRPRLVDPRRGGFEITLGEWAIVPEARALRPGPVTFVVHNRGTMAHGFEIELEGESSGSGSGDLFKAEGELLEPGESARLTLDLAPGVHKIECLVDGHDDLGMEGPLEVRDDAPLVPDERSSAGARERGEASVAIADFAFEPAALEVPVGGEVEWRNDDPAPHTVSATDESFDSGTLDPGDAFSFTFATAGTYRYRCNVHPDMTGIVRVE